MALAWLPVVGSVIGGLAGSLAWGVSFVAPPAFVVATAFAGSVVLSGAVHVDGFLDSCDALVASVPAQRRLEIMKDPRHGTFALAGFAVAGAFWIAAVAAIPAGRLPFALAFAGGAARFAAVLNAFVVPYGRAGASAGAFARKPPVAVLASAGVGLVALAFLVGEWIWTAAAVAGCACALWFGRAAARRLGGAIVGDVYGAIVVVIDVALLSAIALLKGH